MPDMRFAPASWDKGAAAFEEESTGFRARADAVLGGMTVDELGCNNGGTLADGALAMIMPALLASMTETAQGISGGVAACGEAMSATATAYRNTEKHNTEAANDAGTTT